MPTGRLQQVQEKEDAEQPRDVVTVSGLKAWLPFFISIIVMVVSLAASYTQIDNRITTVKADQVRLETVLTDHLQDVDTIRAERDKQYLEMQIVLAQIQKDIAYIRTQIDATK